MVTINCHSLDKELNASGCISKFDCIGQDIDDDLLQLHIITDIVVADTTGYTAFVMEPLLITLGHYHCVDLFEHITE